MINLLYTKAKKFGLTNINRWFKGVPHHPKSKEIVQFLVKLDSQDFNNYFDWEIGGDGDNGEALMYQLDVYFELKDKLQEIKYDRRTKRTRS